MLKFLLCCLIAGLFWACGNADSSDDNPIIPVLSSSNSNIGTSSSSEESSSNSNIGTSSSSEESSSSSNIGTSSSSEESSSSSNIGTSSSSEESSSSSNFGTSSSSEESSSSSNIGTSSSSEESSSSSNIKTSSSSEESSSSEYYKLSWDYLNSSIPYDTIIDSRDGQIYKVVTIGNQTWMAENLNYYDTIQHPELKSLSWCFNDINVNCENRGRLYKHPAAWDYEDGADLYKDVYKGGKYRNENGKFDSLLVQGICPDGWRIPTRSEWIALSNRCNIRSEKWGGTNKCGISVFASGWRSVDADDSSLVKYVGSVARFWTSSWISGFTSIVEFEKNGTSNVVGSGAQNAHSVRCVKDK